MTAIVDCLRAEAERTSDHATGRTAQKFAGTIWVDEAASEVMRVEANVDR